MTEFITRCCFGSKSFEVIIRTDDEEHYKAAQDFARRLIDHGKPRTNADWIRSLSDEELAEMFSGLCRNAESCDNCPLDGQCPGGSFDCCAWGLWLKQPVEDDSDG